MQLIAESQFRLLLGIHWVLWQTVRVYFMIKVKGLKPSFQKRDMLEMLFTNMFGIIVILIPIYALSTWIDFGHVPLSAWLRYLVGVPFLVCQLLLFTWTHQTLGKNWSAFLDIYKEHSLVTNGPYHYVRHPMYSSWFFGGIGYFFISANWFLAAVYFCTLLLMYFYRVPLEEKMMVDKFGDAYREYEARSGRLFPKLLS